MASKLPSDDVLMDYYHEGLTDREIATLHHCTVQAVNKRFHKMGVTRLSPENTRVNALIRHRWPGIYYSQESDSHHAADASKALRVWLRRRLGDKTLTKNQVGMADRWERGIRERNEVLCYGPEGWSYRPRKKKDGQRVIDWPESMHYSDKALVELLDLPTEVPAPVAV
jgi:hypothetical protein